MKYEQIKLGLGLGSMLALAPVVVATTAVVTTAFVGVVVVGAAGVAITSKVTRS
jgi:hypothetical protein